MAAPERFAQTSNFAALRMGTFTGLILGIAIAAAFITGSVLLLLLLLRSGPAAGMKARPARASPREQWLRPIERLRFQPQQLRRIGLGHLHNVRLGDALRDQSFVERQQSVRMERIVGLTQVG